MPSGLDGRHYDPPISSLIDRPYRDLVPGARRVVRRRALQTRASETIAPKLNRSVLSVVGDSHARIFRQISRAGLLPRTWVDVLSIPGATAFGMENPNSTTNALVRFSEFLDRTPRHRRTVFVLGEVDCGFLVWYRSMTRGTTVELEVEQSLKRYTTFLDGIVERGHDRITLVSVTPPTVEDYSAWRGLGNARQEVTASLEERTAVTLAYNLELRAWTERTSSTFIDLYPDVIDASTGLVAQRFVRFFSADRTDHHLAQEPLAELLVQRIEALRATGW